MKISYDHNKEKYKIVQDFKNEHKDFDVKDYAYGNNESIIKVALIYYDEEKNTKSNIAIITEKGIGILDLVGGNKDYSYANNENIKIYNENSVKFPLYNSKTEKIIEYKVIVTEDDIGTNYKIESND